MNFNEASDMDPKTKVLMAIMDMASSHPAFSRDHFDARDVDGLAEIGGDTCDWTTVGILAQIGLSDE